jgi:CheY-like chemotaxis protein/HPt (histidine-containing phosphotransfer) domain-containing protein
MLSSVLVAAPTVVQGGASPPAVEASFAKRYPLRILLAEDNAVNQKVALHLLQKIGYRADVAANGLEVLAALRRQPYDVLLMDVQMPEMDGLEATRRIRQQWPAAQQPYIIAITANAMQGDRERCLEAGMDGYVSKPLQPKELFDAIESLFKPVGGGAGDFGPVEAALSPPAVPRVDDPVDYAAVLDRVDGDLELLCELVELFCDSTPKQLSAIRDAVASGDSEALARAAHALKGAVGNFVPNGGVFEMTLKLEMMGRDGDLVHAEAARIALEKEIERLQSALIALGKAKPAKRKARREG